MAPVFKHVFSERTAALAAFAVVALLPLALGFNAYYLSIFIPALIMGGVAIAWNLLAGVCGQVSFGHGAFFGLGAYASAILVTKLGLSPYLGMLAGAAVGALGSLVIGLPAFRLHGAYFALAILGFAEVCKLLALNLTGLTEGSQGIMNIPPLSEISLAGFRLDFYISRVSNYYLAGLLLLAVYLTAYMLKRSQLGLAMSAVHGDQETAAGIGVNVVKTKALALLASAACTGLMGGFYAHYVRFLSPDSAFDAHWSVMPIVAALFGGMRTLIGPLAGALVITSLDEFFFKQFFASGHKLFFGLLLAVVIVWAPSGLLGRRVQDQGLGQEP